MGKASSDKIERNRFAGCSNFLGQGRHSITRVHEREFRKEVNPGVFSFREKQELGMN